jgi:hypothetical protein
MLSTDHVDNLDRATSGDDTRPPATRVLNDAAERTQKKHRIETPETKLAVVTVFLSCLKNTQFEGNPHAENALARFLSACAAEHPAVILSRLAWAVAYCLLQQLDSPSEEDMKAMVDAAVKAGTGAKGACLFDGPSIDFPLGNGEKVQVLVREGTGNNSRDSPLFRHTAVAAFEDSSAATVARAIIGEFNPLPLLYGASGSGKTMCGISIVAKLNRYNDAPGACVRIRCNAAWFRFDPARLSDLPLKPLPRLRAFFNQHPEGVFGTHAFEETYGPAEHTQDERDLVAQQFVLQAIDKVIDTRHREAPKEKRLLVVFLDDAEECPAFVRAMCCRFDTLQDIISTRYSGGKCPVRLIMAGTSIEGSDQRVGSEHTSIVRYHVRPRTWARLKAKLPRAAQAVKDLLDNDESTLARIVNGMVQNARVAANVANAICRLMTPSADATVLQTDPALALKYAAVTAGEAYRQLNNCRREPHIATNLAMLLRAMAQQTSTKPLHALAAYC